MPANTVWTPHTILLKGELSYVREEKLAGGTIYPGHLVMGSAGTLIKQNAQGVNARPWFALEDAFQGKTITQAYVSGDRVNYHIAQPGDVIYARLAAGAAAVVADDVVVPAGDGTVALVSGALPPVLYKSVADSAAITNVATITAFDKSYTIPANSLRVGDTIRIHAVADCPSTNSTDTLILTLKIGSTTIIATGAVDVANNDVGIIDAVLTVRTIGSSGTLVGSGNWSLGVPGTATTRSFTLASTTINTTTTNAVTVSATWSVASASNQVILRQLVVSLDRAVDGPGWAVYEAKDNSAGIAEAFVKIRI